LPGGEAFLFGAKISGGGDHGGVIGGVLEFAHKRNGRSQTSASCSQVLK